jgi:hypothetical protein
MNDFNGKSIIHNSVYMDVHCGDFVNIYYIDAVEMVYETPSEIQYNRTPELKTACSRLTLIGKLI